ncbi:hypothetical protein FA95DRAFT_1535528 [Auriscalpium vulgare]|uniref:Uncharacterized protein n=1 Tax=Auriscalpium vulgare TaxID=40419 RepID=A0ACB8S422_9AGAM|nr:hypothetical protein FA95DRAFT_1535528 [Auriscalpium vulgare]
MKVFAIGGSRNIGYYASLRLLGESRSRRPWSVDSHSFATEKGATVTFLLRNPGAFDSDPKIQEYVQKGTARLVKGDALNKNEVRQGWVTAGQPEADSTTEGVDVVLFTIGGTPSFSPLRGFVISPADLCTRSMLNVLSTLPRSEHAPPRIIALSSVGLSHISHKSLPLSMRLLYSLALGQPHEDKRGMEEVLAHCLGAGEAPGGTTSPKILPPGWEATDGLPGKGELPAVVVVRPALLTDGVCRADEAGTKANAYRVRSDGDLPVAGGYTISRRDVSHFIAERLLGAEWSEWQGKGVSLAI